MKFRLVFVFIFSSSLVLHAQEDEKQKLPPFDMLPKGGEVKEIYTLEYETIYQVFNLKGELVLDSIGEFIDMTLLTKGIYFIKSEGKTFKYEKLTESPKSLEPDQLEKGG